LADEGPRRRVRVTRMPIYCVDAVEQTMRLLESALLGKERSRQVHEPGKDERFAGASAGEILSSGKGGLRREQIVRRAICVPQLGPGPRLEVRQLFCSSSA